MAHPAVKINQARAPSIKRAFDNNIFRAQPRHTARLLIGRKAPPIAIAHTTILFL